MIEPAPLLEIAAALRSGQLDVLEYVEQACDRVDALDPQIAALLPEPDRRARLRREALALRDRFPTPESRPPLYGVLLGVKDIFRADGFQTRAGSKLPPELFEGMEASSVRALRENGALVLGKTVTTEFAYFEPNGTRNPHNLAHTPGGSSSGSAAAVAAGFCPLALGTQTIGSVVRPAGYCGIVGFKPSWGRIPTDGVIPISPALDHVGLFTPDVPGMELGASLLCRGWRALDPSPDAPRPVLGVPEGAYLEQASLEALLVFRSNIQLLEFAGYTVKRVPLLGDIQAITAHNHHVMSAEMWDSHVNYFPARESLYRPRTAAMIRDGQAVTPEQRQAAHSAQAETRAAIHAAMAEHGIDLWIAPAATGAAPLGLDSTGSPAMSLPWTFAGLPTLAVPTRHQNADGLPFGLQFVGGFMGDERLLRWCIPAAAAFGKHSGGY
jgi:Asp-tRNA(Asn)/Glu-tRNA(Gln) amidotransferase A subunit family amidase